jgi:hypothetical protein
MVLPGPGRRGRLDSLTRSSNLLLIRSGSFRILPRESGRRRDRIVQDGRADRTMLGRPWDVRESGVRWPACLQYPQLSLLYARGVTHCMDTEVECGAREVRQMQLGSSQRRVGGGTRELYPTETTRAITVGQPRASRRGQAWDGWWQRRASNDRGCRLICV